MTFHTPLRYPGGKRRLLAVVTRLLRENALREIEYAEPYAGGAAVALALLFDGYASVIHLNDRSRPVYAFWASVLNNTADLCARVNATPITMDEWYKQREVFVSGESAELFDLGFAALFLNRVNRSGILHGGVIGGKRQDGAWTMDARFNKPELVRRINRIGSCRDSIQLHQLDAVDFVNDELSHISRNGLAFFDPPYMESGRDLYLDDYSPERHRELAESVKRLNMPWLCTYDRAAVEHNLFPDHRRIEYRLPYMAQGRHRGEEVMFLSHDLNLPPEWTDSTKPIRLTQSTDRYKLHGRVFPTPTQRNSNSSLASHSPIAKQRVAARQQPRSACSPRA